MTKARAARRHPDRHDQARNSVALCYIRPDDVDGRYHDAVLNLLLYDRDNGHLVGCSIGVEANRIAKGRNEVVRSFLDNTDCEWLFWLDTDMTFTTTCLETLHAAADPDEKPVVGALCFAGGRTKITPTIYMLSNESGKLESETILQYPSNMVIEVGGTGSACILIHRSVLQRIKEFYPADHPLPWYQDVVHDNRDFGEDLIFCMRARANGARIWIHTGVKTGHRKKWTMDEAAFVNYAARLDAAAEESGVSPDEKLKLEELPNLAVVL